MAISFPINRFLITIGLFISGATFAQRTNSSPSIIISENVARKSYNEGDSLSFVMKNIDKLGSSYTIEAVVLSADSLYDHIYYNAVYTAYFSRDATFFKKLKELRAAARKDKGVHYLLPKLAWTEYRILPNSSFKYSILLKGKRLDKGVKMKLVIGQDLFEGEQLYVETEPFTIFVLPDLDGKVSWGD